MTPWSVGLTPEAEDGLALAWLDADDRQAITAAETAIHDLLASDPVGNGTPVAEGLYKIAYSPLVAFYSVDHAQRRVEVSHFWRPH
jgi:hypothetical protein